MATDQNKHILEELKAIRTDLDYLKSHIRDGDVVLTRDDVEALAQAEMDFKSGKTKRLA